MREERVFFGSWTEGMLPTAGRAGEGQRAQPGYKPQGLLPSDPHPPAQPGVLKVPQTCKAGAQMLK